MYRRTNFHGAFMLFGVIAAILYWGCSTPPEPLVPGNVHIRRLQSDSGSGSEGSGSTEDNSNFRSSIAGWNRIPTDGFPDYSARHLGAGATVPPHERGWKLIYSPGVGELLLELPHAERLFQISLTSPSGRIFRKRGQNIVNNHRQSLDDGSRYEYIQFLLYPHGNLESGDWHLLATVDREHRLESIISIEPEQPAITNAPDPSPFESIPLQLDPEKPVYIHLSRNSHQTHREPIQLVFLRMEGTDSRGNSLFVPKIAFELENSAQLLMMKGVLTVGEDLPVGRYLMGSNLYGSYEVFPMNFFHIP